MAPSSAWRDDSPGSACLDARHVRPFPATSKAHRMHLPTRSLWPTLRWADGRSVAAADGPDARRRCSYHRPGKEARINFQRQRQFRCLKGPEVKACLMQTRQHGHAANRARAHRSCASYLEWRLGPERLVGVAEATPARRVMMTRARLTWSAPEWLAALTEPVLSVFRSQLP